MTLLAKKHLTFIDKYQKYTFEFSGKFAVRFHDEKYFQCILTKLAKIIMPYANNSVSLAFIPSTYRNINFSAMLCVAVF